MISVWVTTSTPIVMMLTAIRDRPAIGHTSSRCTTSATSHGGADAGQ